MSYPVFDPSVMPFRLIPIEIQRKETKRYLANRALGGSGHITLKIISVDGLDSAKMNALYDFWKNDCQYGIQPFLISLPFFGSLGINDVNPDLLVRFASDLSSSYENAWETTLKLKIIANAEYVNGVLTNIIPVQDPTKDGALQVDDVDFVPPPTSSGRGYSLGDIDSIIGLKFSDESAIITSASIPTKTSISSGVSSGYRGYSLGGVTETSPGTNNTTNIIQGIQFSDETAVNPASSLSETTYYCWGVSSDVRGYSMGGNETINPPISETKDTIQGIQFSDETAINPAATLSEQKVNAVGVNSSTRGYSIGGTLTDYSISSNIDGIQFSDETAINPSASIASPKSNGCGVSSQDNGYMIGGRDSSVTTSTTINGLRFSDETAINISASISVAIASNIGIFSLVRGYSLGGQIDGGAETSEIEGIQFSDNTAINPSAVLDYAIYRSAGVQSN